MFDKITSRINKLSYGLDPNYVQPFKIAQKVINGLYEGVTTAELDYIHSLVLSFFGGLINSLIVF